MASQQSAYTGAGAFPPPLRFVCPVVYRQPGAPPPPLVRLPPPGFAPYAQSAISCLPPSGGPPFGCPPPHFLHQPASPPPNLGGQRHPSPGTLRQHLHDTSGANGGVMVFNAPPPGFAPPTPVRRPSLPPGPPPMSSQSHNGQHDNLNYGEPNQVPTQTPSGLDVKASKDGNADGAEHKTDPDNGAGRMSTEELQRKIAQMKLRIEKQRTYERVKEAEHAEYVEDMEDKIKAALDSVPSSSAQADETDSLVPHFKLEKHYRRVRADIAEQISKQDSSNEALMSRLEQTKRAIRTETEAVVRLQQERNAASTDEQVKNRNRAITAETAVLALRKKLELGRLTKELHDARQTTSVVERIRSKLAQHCVRQNGEGVAEPLTDYISGLLTEYKTSHIKWIATVKEIEKLIEISERQHDAHIAAVSSATDARQLSDLPLIPPAIVPPSPGVPGLSDALLAQLRAVS